MAYRILPWPTAYEPPEALGGEELGPWEPLEEPWKARGGREVAWPTLYFVDGKERVEALLFDGRRYALLGALAVGALLWKEGTLRLLEERVWVRRYAVGLEAPLEVGGLRYEPLEGEGDPMALLQALQGERARLEAALAQGLEGGVVVMDGPLPFDNRPALGLIKRHWARYLPEDKEGLLVALRPGERTPAFRKRRRVGGVTLCLASWYLALPLPGGYPPGAGLLRVEAPEAGFEALAELSLSLGQALASHPAKDPRAPQNLLPIGGLERVLGRWLGDRRVVVRILARHLGGVR